MKNIEEINLWRVDVRYEKKIEILVEAENRVDAEKIARQAAYNIDLPDICVGSEMDSSRVTVHPYPTRFNTMMSDNREWYVWRAGEKFAVCDELRDRVAELTEEEEEKKES